MRNWSILSPLCGAFLAKHGQLSVALLFDPDPSSPGLGRAKRCKLEQLEGHKFSQIFVPLSPQPATGKAYAKRLNDESEIAGRLLRRSSYRC